LFLDALLLLERELLFSEAGLALQSIEREVVGWKATDALLAIVIGVLNWTGLHIGIFLLWNICRVAWTWLLSLSFD
jgi:hypothetical protein